MPLHLKNGIEDPHIFAHNGIPFAYFRDSEADIRQTLTEFPSLLTMKEGELKVAWDLYGKRLKDKITSVHPNMRFNNALWAAGVLTSIQLMGIQIRETEKRKTSRLHGPKVIPDKAVIELFFGQSRTCDAFSYLEAYTEAYKPINLDLEAVQMVMEPQFTVLQRNLLYA